MERCWLQFMQEKGESSNGKGTSKMRKPPCEPRSGMEAKHLFTRIRVWRRLC